MFKRDTTTVGIDDVKAFIADKSFPCVGAKSALNKDRMRMLRLGTMASPDSTRALWEALVKYAQEFPNPGSVPVSFVAVFDDAVADEAEFETLLWQQLQALHDHDHDMGIVWDRSVSSDPSKVDFSFSVGGRAFFVVGLHPGASRLARRTPAPCIVFNFHNQFESLKASGKYAGMQDAIRTRDTALQGSVNPVLARFGESSEAVQYSGRATEGEWKCPFHARGSAHD
jgi:FPC/CPF motif-containing protein YcgG